MAEWSNDERGVIGYGSTVSYSLDDVAYYVVPGTFDKDAPNGEVPEVNTTTDDSTDECKEYIPGLYDPKEFKFMARFKKSNRYTLEELHGYHQTRTTLWWVVEKPGFFQWKCSGWIKTMPPKMPTEDSCTIEITVKLAGKPTMLVTNEE